VKRKQNNTALIPEERVSQAILVLRGQKVMLDSDLAKLYGVTTGNLNKAIKRNINRFPADFMFRLNKKEVENVLIFQIGRPKTDPRGGARHLPYVFTEHGALMLGNVLKSSKAVEMSIVVVRAFVRMRQMLSTNIQMAHKLAEIDRRVSGHDENIKGLIVAIRRLMTKPKPEPERRPIGFGVHYRKRSVK
jgi:phage regulator Rha-like protein